MPNNVKRSPVNYRIALGIIYKYLGPVNVSKWSLPQPAAESSSLPSGQSLSPSQSQRLGTQAYEPGQLNNPGAHVTEPEEETLQRY